MFPITHSQSDNIAGGTMQTSTTLHQSGRFDVVTRIYTKVKLRGFTGGVCVVITDANDGHRLWASSIHSFGVDGEYVGRSDRTEHWSEQVPPEVISCSGGIAIVHIHDPKSRWDDHAQNIIDAMKHNLFKWK